MNKFIIKVSSAKMPSSCWGRYVHVAVIETDGRDAVSMISERAAGVVRIVHYSSNCHVGSTPRSASGRAIAHAEALALELNEARAAA